jgi:hypothetical protein
MGDQTDEQNEPTIHVDSDWKKRAREERTLGDDAAETRSAPEDGVEKDARADAGEDAARPPFPDATLATHLSHLVAEATMAMGDMDHPVSGKKETDLGLAKFLIDTLAMLREKTEGNRDEVETRIFDEALYRLQLRFVELTKSTGPE